MAQTIDLNRFKDAVGFVLRCRAWTNRRIGNVSKITTSEDAEQDAKTKPRIRITKSLIVCEEYDKVVGFQSSLQKWVLLNTVPSFFTDGFQLTGLSGVEPIEKRMRKAQGELAVLVKALLAVYPAKIDEARAALGEQFNERDYPSVEELQRAFSLRWNWISFTVPAGLPDEIRKAEQDKLEKQFADAGEQITLALRAGFAELVNHAVDRLSPGADGKVKIFRDSMIGNIQEFLDTFSQRNLMNDVELAQLVARAREVLSAGGGINAQKLRDYADKKDTTRAAFEEIKGKLDGMIQTKPARQFDFDDDTPAQPAQPGQGEAAATPATAAA